MNDAGLDELERLARGVDRFPYDPWDNASGWHAGDGDQAGRWNHAAYLNTAGRDLIVTMGPDRVLALIGRIRSLETAMRLWQETAERRLSVGAIPDWGALLATTYRVLGPALEDAR